MTKTLLKVINHLSLIKVIVGLAKLANPFCSSTFELPFYGSLVCEALMTPAMSISIFKLAFVCISIEVAYFTTAMWNKFIQIESGRLIRKLSDNFA